MAHAIRTHRLLIVADEGCGVQELCRGARERANAHTAIRFVAPVHACPADEDEGRCSLQAVLDEALDCLWRHGLEASGQLGSADPVTAIEEALADFPADEILIFTGPDRETWWLHKEVLERAHARFRLPIAQVVFNVRRELAVA